VSASLEEVQRAFTRLCFDRVPSEADLALLHDDRERWLMYRKMVRSRLFKSVRSALPKTAELLGKKGFDRAMAHYLAEHGPRTRFIREVVHELLAHSLESWERDPALPPHLADVARVEEAKWRVSSLPWTDVDAGEFDFEKPPVMNPTVRAVTLRYGVDKNMDAPEKLAEPRLLLVYRKPDDARLFTHALDPIESRLFTAWAEGASGAEGARKVLAELGREADPAYVDALATLLGALIERKTILGSRR
jgi:hypothetical protein